MFSLVVAIPKSLTALAKLKALMSETLGEGKGWKDAHILAPLFTLLLFEFSIFLNVCS